MYRAGMVNFFWLKVNKILRFTQNTSKHLIYPAVEGGCCKVQSKHKCFKPI